MGAAYQIHDQGGCYFLTFQVTQWLDVFSRQRYRDVIVDSFSYCRDCKGLRLIAYVIMTNHVHLIAQTKSEEGLSAIVRDIKKFTSGQIISSIINEPESRRKHLLPLLRETGRRTKRTKVFQFWTHENHAVELITDDIV